MVTRNLVVAAVLAMAAAGCGGSGDDGGQPKADGLVENSPPCDEVWVAGETLPEDYDGCLIQGNEVAVFSPADCPSGAQYATYADQFYAVPGDTIEESSSGDIFSDPEFQKFTESC